MTDWLEVHQIITNDRGVFCENCGCALWVELHHCLVHRMKNHPELDCIENLMAVCIDCHSHSNGFETRQQFWKSQCKIYGKEHMREWWDGLSLKVKPNFETEA